MRAPNFGLIKLCDAPESNNITTGLWLIENVPVMTGAPSKRSVSVVNNPSMPDLISLHFVLVLFVLPGVLALRVFTSKVIRNPTIKETIGAARMRGWWSIRPWAILLRFMGDVRRPAAEVAGIPNALD